MKRSWIVDKTAPVLVTGANGFVGRRVVAALAEYGFRRIRCFVRTKQNAVGLQQLGADSGSTVELVEGNLLIPEDCALAVKDISVIYHLAAGTGKSFAGCFMNSVVTTRNLLEAAIAEPALKRLVSVSSLAVYTGFGARRGTLLEEDCPVEQDHMERYDPYCYGKIKQDEMVRAYGKKHGIPYVIVRPGPVYGPGKKALTGRVGIDSFGPFLHIGGSNKLPLIFVDNCADAIVLAGLVEGLEREEFIAVDDDLPTCRAFLRSYKKNVRRFRSIHVSYPMFYFLSWLWERYSKCSQGQLPLLLNRRMCAAYYKRRTYSNRKLKERTGWLPKIPYAEASRRYFEFMRAGEPQA